MVCRLTFWVVFVIWLLKLMQPGYLRFYDAKSGFFGILQNFASTESSNKPSTQEVVPPREQAEIRSVSSPNTSSSSDSVSCQPSNSFERILAAQGMFECKSGSGVSETEN
ncbi:MAG: hypothetical protein KME64_41490 [Scytonematopsis contorta HA4267-MV1]|jgi:hypothetical protein|nr:hypothetical protein [Scytonematopsis contorta HA4267-MV1]